MPSEPTRFDLASARAGTRVAAYRWSPPGTPHAIAQLTHGVGEHAMRYADVAEALTARGYVVYAHDHLGHGNSASSPDDFGVLGETGWTELVADIGRVGAHARDKHPSLPLVLIAHSMGSFAAQQYLLDHSADVDAVVLSGTAAIDLLEPMMDLDAPMDLSAFNAAFEPARTEFDWLSRDADQVDRYIADPWCGFGLDTAGGRAMFIGAREVGDAARVAGMRDDLPVYITVGEQDPVNGALALVQPLVERYRAAGLGDVTLRTYPDARHEVFNETNRDEVVGDMIDWMDAKTDAKAQERR